MSMINVVYYCYSRCLNKLLKLYYVGSKKEMRWKKWDRKSVVGALEVYQNVMFGNGSYYYTHDSLAKFNMYLLFNLVNYQSHSLFNFCLSRLNMDVQ
jgi:hypothetical protein